MSSLILLVLIVILVIASLKMTSESQRIIVYRMGKFFGLRGPGLIFIIPYIDKCMKISVGDRGELITGHLARIGKAEVPVKIHGLAVKGQSVRIKGFTEKDAIVVLDQAQAKEFVRQK